MTPHPTPPPKRRKSVTFPSARLKAREMPSGAAQEGSGSGAQCSDTPEGSPAPSASQGRPITRIAGYGTCSCGAEWTGHNTSHCSGCHRTFSSISAFDQHRSGSHAKGERHCLDPASVGLVPVTKRYWSGWGCPGEHPRLRGDGDDRTTPDSTKARVREDLGPSHESSSTAKQREARHEPI